MQPEEIILSVSLHGFCGSSSQVYCGMVYIRAETTLRIRVSFYVLKPKYRLYKKVLGFALLVKVLKDLLVALKGRVSTDSVYYWSDSEVALWWVKGKVLEVMVGK